MAKEHPIRIIEALYEDTSGVVYRARDGAGNKVHLRKPKEQRERAAADQLACQTAVERLQGIHHASLHGLVSGGCDPEDDQPFVAIKPVEGTHLAQKIKSGPISVELATTLISQALEASELLSHLLADDGVWIETSPESILFIDKHEEPLFMFWPSPLKAKREDARKQSFQDLVDIAEQALHWTGREADGREGGHLQMWLKWLKETDEYVQVREAREMIAAAAGIEPPDSLEKLVEDAHHKPEHSLNLSKWSQLLQRQVPKMPLFTTLLLMLVIQVVFGWVIVQGINSKIDDELRQLNSSYPSTSYTIGRDAERKDEPSSKP